MAKPTSRVLQVLELLQSAGARSVGELAGLLGVDKRTVRRYVEHLRELDIPVESLRGRYGGYRIAAGYRLPPLMFTDEEAIAVLLGLVEMRARPGSAATRTAAETAAAKVRRAIPRSLASRVSTLLDDAVWTSDGARDDAPDAAVLLTVADAVHTRRELAIRYTSADGDRSDRTLRPSDLVEYRARWYLLAVDVRSGQERTFRLDRIVSARTLSSSFPQPPDHDAKARLLSHFAEAEYEHRVTLRIHASREHIEAHVPGSVAVIEQVTTATGPDEPPWHRAEIRAVRLDWIPKVIVDLECPVIVDGPDELRDLVSQCATRLAAAAARR